MDRACEKREVSDLRMLIAQIAHTHRPGRAPGSYLPLRPWTKLGPGEPSPVMLS